MLLLSIPVADLLIAACCVAFQWELVCCPWNVVHGLSSRGDHSMPIDFDEFPSVFSMLNSPFPVPWPHHKIASKDMTPGVAAVLWKEGSQHLSFGGTSVGEPICITS